MFRIFLDNAEFPNPLNWSEFTETLERDEALNGIFAKYEIKLNYSGKAYDYILKKYKSNGFCNTIDVRIEYKCQSTYKELMRGFIFLSDCKFNLNKCIVECDIIDNSFGALINNNKSIKTYIGSSLSKNGVAITPCDYDSVQFFIPSTGSYTGDQRHCYLVSDAFRFLIDFMSDGTVGFESDFLTTNVIPYYGVNGMRLVTGNEIRTASHTSSPFISFVDLFREVNIKYPIFFTIINKNGKPTIKIEDINYFYNDTYSIKIKNIPELFLSFNNELLYSSVKFGCKTSSDNSVIDSFRQVRFFNFIEEEYYFQGKCNIDKTLDLTGTYIYDTNIIEEVFDTDNTNEQYDKDVFFVQCAGAYAVNTPSPETQVLPLYYNGNLTNNKIAERYKFAGNVALYLGNNDDFFRAELTSDVDYYSGSFSSPPLPIVFDDDSTPPNFDNNGNYNNTTGHYVSPANGVYTFGGVGHFSVEFNYSNSYEQCDSLQQRIAISLFVYDASNNRVMFLEPDPLFVEQTVYRDSLFYIDLPYNFNSVYLPAGYYAEVNISMSYYIGCVISGGAFTYYNKKMLSTSYFECTQSINGGGVYRVADLEDYFTAKLEFKYPIDNASYNQLKEDLSKSVIVNNGDPQNYTSWIRKVVRKLANGETTFEMITNERKITNGTNT